MQNDLYLAFINSEKSFNTGHEDMIHMLDEIGLDKKDIQLITNIYWDHQRAMLKQDGKQQNGLSLKEQ